MLKTKISWYKFENYKFDEFAAAKPAASFLWTNTNSEKETKFNSEWCPKDKEGLLFVS